jgi:outer membrane protein assembly factor BamB
MGRRLHKRTFCFIAVLFLISNNFLINNFAEAKETEITNAEQFEKGFRYNIQGWIYLHIEGEPYERGYQHGYLLANEIVDMLNRWSHTIHFHRTIKRINKRVSELRYHKIADRWWDFCRNQCDRIYWDKFPMEYQQEIRGIADGVNARGLKLFGRKIDYKDILAMNEMYEFMSKLTSLRMGIRPIRQLLHQLQKVEPASESIGLKDFVEGFLSDEPPHHCNGFIAVGDATTDGQMVFSQSTICGGSNWWWNYYISLRWNILLDVQPSTGNRIIMSSSPGIIWSDEDYYQNDNGIVLLETTVPQGLFDNIGLPLSVRARMAMQYGNSIDDVVYYLRYRNDGSMNAVWLIGDTKTGEIARFELGYNANAIFRTKNGFHWSANTPMDFKVRFEKFKVSKNFLFNSLMWILTKNNQFGYSSIRYIPTRRDVKFEEYGNKYYGKIDSDIVKEIMSDPVIMSSITDIKLTDSKLLEQNGLWAFFGNPGKALNYTNIDTTSHKSESMYPNGWVRVFGLPSKGDITFTTHDNFEGKETDVIWEFNTEFHKNEFKSSGAVIDDTLYITGSNEMIYAFDKNNGNLIWKKTIGENPSIPFVYNDLILISYSEGIAIVDKYGSIKRIPSDNEIISSPIVADDMIIFGDNVGKVFSYSLDKRKEEWTIDFSDEIYIASDYDKNIYITSGNNCYAVSLNDQKVAWQFNSSGMITSAPVFKNKKIYFTSWDNNIYALNAKNGELIWKYEIGWGTDISPVISEELIYIGSSDNNLYALNGNNGTLKWIFSSKAAIHSMPVVYGDFLFFGSDDGRLYAVNKTNGWGEWFFAANMTIDDDLLNYITTPILSNPVVNNGTAYIGAKGIIYALDAQTIEKTKSNDDGDENNILSEPGTFIILSLIVIIIATLLYLFLSKKRFK